MFPLGTLASLTPACTQLVPTPYAREAGMTFTNSSSK